MLYGTEKYHEFILFYLDLSGLQNKSQKNKNVTVRSKQTLRNECQVVSFPGQ